MMRSVRLEYVFSVCQGGFSFKNSSIEKIQFMYYPKINGFAGIAGIHIINPTGNL